MPVKNMNCSLCYIMYFRKINKEKDHALTIKYSLSNKFTRNFNLELLQRKQGYFILFIGFV